MVKQTKNNLKLNIEIDYPYFYRHYFIKHIEIEENFLNNEETTKVIEEMVKVIERILNTWD